MRTQSRSHNRQQRPVFDEAYFERKGAELVVPDEEIEAWELDSRDLGDLAGGEDYFNAPRFE